MTQDTQNEDTDERLGTRCDIALEELAKAKELAESDGQLDQLREAERIVKSVGESDRMKNGRTPEDALRELL